MTDLGLIADAPPAALTGGDEDAIKRERNQLELDQLRELVKELRQNNDERKKYTRKLFFVMVAWLAIVAYAVFAQGFNRGFFNYGRFHLDNSVIIAMLTTATATVIGVFVIVTNYLFHKKA